MGCELFPCTHISLTQKKKLLSCPLFFFSLSLFLDMYKMSYICTSLHPCVDETLREKKKKHTHTYAGIRGIEKLAHTWNLYMYMKDDDKNDIPPSVDIQYPPDERETGSNAYIYFESSLSSCCYDSSTSTFAPLFLECFARHVDTTSYYCHSNVIFLMYP